MCGDRGEWGEDFIFLASGLGRVLRKPLPPLADDFATLVPPHDDITGLDESIDDMVDFGLEIGVKRRYEVFLEVRYGDEGDREASIRHDGRADSFEPSEGFRKVPVR